MSSEEFQDLLEKFTRGDCSPEEEQFILDWYNNLTSPDDDIAPPDKAATEARIWTAIRPVSGRVRKWPVILRRAAIIAFPLIGAALFYFRSHDRILEYIEPVTERITNLREEKTRYSNDSEVSRRLTLKDGSVVTLQPGSEITMREGFGRKVRRVHLRGEAFFDVVRDPARPFIVNSGEVTTHVLGTSFNVRAYDSDPEITVSVKRGRVSVRAHGAKETGSTAEACREVILTPNQKMVYRRDKEQVLKTLVEKPEIILPESRLFHMQFENALVSEIFQVLEENYGVEIRYNEEQLSHCRLTTKMSEEGLYERIQIICRAIGATYSVDADAVITVDGDGCL